MRRPGEYGDRDHLPRRVRDRVKAPALARFDVDGHARPLGVAERDDDRLLPMVDDVKIKECITTSTCKQEQNQCYERQSVSVRPSTDVAVVRRL